MVDNGLVITEYQGVTFINFQSMSIIDAVVVQSISTSLYELVDQKAIRRIVLDFTNV